MNVLQLTAFRREAFSMSRVLRTSASTLRRYTSQEAGSASAAGREKSKQSKNQDFSSDQKSEHAKSSHNRSQETETHFGFARVLMSEKQNLVGQVFESVAPSYDLMNDAMSLGVHRLWKSAFVSDIAPVRGMRILDCAGGTGDIALRIASATNGGASVIVADINTEMLKVGREKARKAGVSDKSVRFIEANAENLPFADAEFDVYAISFGMRNVPRVEVALSEAFRVLKKGGRFMMLEFGKVQVPPAARLYDTYSFHVIPAIGKYVAGDQESYQYLVESIRQFPAQEEFLEMVKRAGFINATVTDYSLGIAAVYSAFKPAT